MTRSLTNAKVTYEIMYKEGNEIKTDALEDVLLKCDTKEKAELMLSKTHKKALVNILEVEFETATYEMEDEQFFSLAKKVEK